MVGGAAVVAGRLAACVILDEGGGVAGVRWFL